jgi:hypothetical protein
MSPLAPLGPVGPVGPIGPGTPDRLMAILTYPVGHTPFFSSRSVPLALLQANTLSGAVIVVAA